MALPLNFFSFNDPSTDLVGAIVAGTWTSNGRSSIRAKRVCCRAMLFLW